MFPNLRVGLISNTSKQAADFSRAIRWTYESNPRHREVFGDCVSPTKWTDVEWLHRESRWHGSKDVTLYAAGAGGAIISKRFDIILCDDILDEENTSTPEAREKVETWFFKTLLPCLVPDGVVICIGTRWAEGDLYENLTMSPDKGGKGWKKLVRGALVENAEGETESYWPEHWPLWRLEEKRVDLGTALFMCAYQNDIRGLMEGNIFKARNFEDMYFDELPAGRKYTIKMGIDLASSERERADYTARVVTAVDEDGNYYVLSVYRDKREADHPEFILDGWLAYPNMGLVRCENQQFQSTLIKTVMQQYPWIPIEGIRSDVDKVTRARAVAAKYEAHKIHHHSSLKGSDFEMELLSFPKGHDDMVDALGFSLDLTGGGFFFGTLKR
jgi:predicted phage terminase large subunit-like protein